HFDQVVSVELEVLAPAGRLWTRVKAAPIHVRERPALAQGLQPRPRRRWTRPTMHEQDLGARAFASHGNRGRVRAHVHRSLATAKTRAYRRRIGIAHASTGEHVSLAPALRGVATRPSRLCSWLDATARGRPD